MIYDKPEVALLGDANRVIENTQMKTGPRGDGSQVVDPAYDLDE